MSSSVYKCLHFARLVVGDVAALRFLCVYQSFAIPRRLISMVSFCIPVIALLIAFSGELIGAISIEFPNSPALLFSDPK